MLSEVLSGEDLKTSTNLIYEVLRAELRKIRVCWDITQSRLVNSYQCFVVDCYLHLQGLQVKVNSDLHRQK
jgi:hypothetical protein